jgi:hypothetical protein
LLTASLNRWLVLVFPLWIVVVSGLIWRRARSEASRAPVAPEASRA